MSLDSKVKKYSKYIVGYAYQVFSYEIDTYLVIKKDNIEFIPYNWYEYGSPNRKEEIINSLEEDGYKDISFYKENNEIKVLRKEFEGDNNEKNNNY